MLSNFTAVQKILNPVNASLAKTIQAHNSFSAKNQQYSFSIIFVSNGFSSMFSPFSSVT